MDCSWHLQSPVFIHTQLVSSGGVSGADLHLNFLSLICCIYEITDKTWEDSE